MYFEGLPDPRFAYIAPFYSQAKKIAWAYLKRYAGSGARKISESELSITLRHNGATITLFGADNPDSFRGQYFDGVILDEYGNMRPSIWSEVLLPTLLDRRGWATFIGTPNGPNHFRDLFHHASKDPSRWFVDLLPVSQTKLIAEEELDEMRRLMSEEEYDQEMECSFEASARGAYYAREMKRAKTTGQIGNYGADSNLLLHFVFDIGRTDDTALGAFQEWPHGVNIVHAESENGHGAQHWIKRIHEVCDMYGCQRGTIWLPADARAKTWATLRSGWEQFIDAGIRPSLIPGLDILDGINAARYVFQFINFNEVSTEKLILALQSYRRRWDEDKQAFANDPLHDWSSHLADMFRYLGIVARFPHSRPVDVPMSMEEANKRIAAAVKPLHYNFSLEDLWEHADARNDGAIQ